MNVKMHSCSIWSSADRPNYSTNVDLAYPYSEMPHQGNRKYLTIPVSPTDIVKHVDYWGEGRIASGEGIHGFPKSYNVNHQYRLVSCGPDRDKKIPNRIPLVSYNDCNTSAFITDNSVLIVTIPGARMNKNCIRDIARMVNDKRGKVVVYGTYDSGEMSDLTAQLKIKGLFLSENATLDSELSGLTYFDSYVAFTTSCKNEKDKKAETLKDLIDCLDKGDYDAAVYISQCNIKFVSEAVTKVIRSKPQHVMPYAYKLWIAGEASQYIVRNHFPEPYQHILNKSGESLRIKNKEYGLIVTVGYVSDIITYNVFGLKLKTSIKEAPSVGVKFYPKYEKGEVTFAIVNDQKYVIKVVDDQDEELSYCVALPSTTPDKLTDDDCMFLLEPSIGDDGKVLFIIKHPRNNQLIKMDEDENEFTDKKIKGREVIGHNGKIDKINDNFLWDIGPYDSVKLSVPLQSIEVLSDTD